MDFNPSRCHVLHVSCSLDPTYNEYSLRGHTLDTVEEATYIGVTLTSKLNCILHIRNTSAKANQSLGFLRCNIKPAPTSTKEQAYISLVRPQVEYSSVVWAPLTEADIYHIKRVQCRATHFTCNIYRTTNSVTDMLSDLGWESLDQCRQKARATLTYKTKHELVAITTSPYLHTPPPTRSRRIHENYVQIQYYRTDYLKHSFFYRAPVIWNCLSVEITEAIYGLNQQKTFILTLLIIQLTIFY